MGRNGLRAAAAGAGYRQPSRVGPKGLVVIVAVATAALVSRAAGGRGYGRGARGWQPSRSPIGPSSNVAAAQAKPLRQLMNSQSNLPARPMRSSAPLTGARGPSPPGGLRSGAP